MIRSVPLVVFVVLVQIVYKARDLVGKDAIEIQSSVCNIDFFNKTTYIAGWIYGPRSFYCGPLQNQ